MAYFRCTGGGSGATLTLTFSSEFYGQTITATNGTKTVTKVAPSTGTMEITLPESGTWVISSTVSGSTYTTTVEVDIDYTATLEAIPNGSTVLPTDDIQTWLKCAGITDKTTYTTLADVLNDVDTFIALCADSNASDYMARSTTWASGVTTDATAMQIVGKYDYCANALLGNATWASAICGSSYADYVISALVPTMTSNTTPSGVASSKDIYQSGYEAYKAFDGNSSTQYIPQEGTDTKWLQYQSVEKICVNKVYIVADATLANLKARVARYELLGSNDGSTWTSTPIATLSTDDITSVTIEWILENHDSYTYHRINEVKKITNGIGYPTVQFYGRVDHGYTGTVIHSAVEDSIYYLDSGSPVPFCTIASGDTETVLASTIESLKNQTITLYSSVAKDPTNLSNDYSKQIRITPNVTEIYLMPENTLYWYGHEDSNLEDISNANGWANWGSGRAWEAPTHNKNNIVINPSASNKDSGVGSVGTIKTTSLNAIASNSSGNTYSRIALANSKSDGSPSDVKFSTTGIYAYTLSDAGSSNKYVMAFEATNASTVTLYALWYE